VSGTVAVPWSNERRRHLHVYYDQCYSVVPKRVEALPINLGNYPRDFSVQLRHSRLNGIELFVDNHANHQPRTEVVIRWTAYFGMLLNKAKLLNLLLLIITFPCQKTLLHLCLGPKTFFKINLEKTI